MAYVSKQLSSASVDEQARKVIDFLEYDLGYSVYDEISSESKVFKVQSDSNRCPAYRHVYSDGSYIRSKLYLYWDLDTHTGDYNAYDPHNHFQLSDQVIYCHGNDYWFALGAASTNYSTYRECIYGKIGGEIQTVFEPTITKLTASGIAGDNATLYVEDSSDFYVGVKYQIIGVPETKCIRWVEINTVPNSTSLTVANLPVTVASGSYIGAVPCTAFGEGHDRYDNRLYGYTHPSSEDDNTDYNWYMYMDPQVREAYRDPDQRQNVWFLSTINMLDISNSVLGHFDSDILGPAQATAGDLLCVHNQSWPINSSVSSGTLTTLTDDTKAWSANEHQDMYVIIIDGDGLGEVKKIISSTATTLTTCTTSDGDLDGELFIRGYGKETNGLDVSIVDNGVESGNSASASYVGDKTIEVEIDSGTTTQSTIVTALEAMSCIRSVSADNPSNTWSTASGVNVVTISGGDGSFWETVPTFYSSYAIYEEAWRSFYDFALKADY